MGGGAVCCSWCRMSPWWEVVRVVRMPCAWLSRWFALVRVVWRFAWFLMDVVPVVELMTTWRAWFTSVWCCIIVLLVGDGEQTAFGCCLVSVPGAARMVGMMERRSVFALMFPGR